MRVSGHDLVGVVLDRRYRVDSPIARGGMSTVYRGLDTRLDRPVAIKIMDPKFAADPQFLARFEFEARAVARLKHPGLVAVYDQGHEDDLAFLVMELVEGGTLRELLRERGPMPPHAMRAVAEPVLDALAVAHSAGLVHRDIKPENVLISDSGEVKIADFGLVRAVAASSTTSSSVILGTAAYLSPEQVATGTADARSDVYAMGILMFEMLTGTTPFNGDTSLTVAYQRLNHDVPAPSSCIAGVPTEIDELVGDATAREPAHRYRDAAEMAAALRAVANALRLPPYRVPAPRRSAEHLTAQLTAQRPATAPPFAPAPPAGPHHTKVVTAATQRPMPPVPVPAAPVAAATSTRPVDPPPQYSAPYPTYIEDRQRSRRALWIWLLIVILLAAAVGTAGWWMGSGRFTAVPQLTGLDATQAQTVISDAGLTAKVHGQHSDTAAVNTVISSDPAPGSRITKHSTVTLNVSLGKPMVPQLGKADDFATVQQRVRDADLQPVDGGDTYSATAPVGTVAALDPAPGTVLRVGDSVKIVRSKGPPPVQLPDLRGSSPDDAKAKLAALGINVKGITEAFDSDVPGGQVIGTDPAQGSTVDAGGGVTLVVSNAVKIPLVMGHTLSSARDELAQLGLSVHVRQMTDSDRSIVLGQNPGVGSLVKPGSQVTLVSLP
ncbi:Stk1 family PASTA domain-containing Ser/Thr kinase [Skermania sp. ID1734]|uniref:Stk1 family PASTA domain-containing Ser/Thr kinase n=1 Tax=Skermania sp. ID1734 TaxID=2597516 RepID=UPI002104A8DE|nr:Stk1 family PASTA domain-containing Ser/Thr kinase [Skermania sp. ID1734]